MHLIPDDAQPHAPTTECGCGPVLVTIRRDDGTTRAAFQHFSPDEAISDGEPEPE